jgi:serine/threonine-protein kinase
MPIHGHRFQHKDDARLNSKESLNSQEITMSDNQMNSRRNILLAAFVMLSVFLQIPIQIVFAQGAVQQQKGGNNNSFVTYEKPTYGIKIRYPTDWEKTEHLSANRFLVNFVSPIKNNNPNTFPATVSVSLEGLNHSISATTIGEFVTGILDTAKRSLTDFQIVESNPNANIAGTSAYKITYTFLSQDPAVKTHFQSMNIWSLQEKKVYSISYTELKSLYASYLPVVQKMIDSFEIIKR